MSLPRVMVHPPHLMPVTGWCNLYKKVWRETLKFSAWHLKALEVMLIDWTSPPETSDGLWSTFFPVPKKGTDKMQGCVDLRKRNSCIRYEHFKMEGLHTIQQLIRRNDLITKVDLSDFFTCTFSSAMSDRRYMRFMWRAKSTSASACPSVWPRPRG